MLNEHVLDKGMRTAHGIIWTWYANIVYFGI